MWFAALATDRARGQWVDPRGGAMRFSDWTRRWFAGRQVRLTIGINDTVRHVHALLPTMLSDAVEEGLLLTNPCRRTGLPKPPRYDAVFLSPAQLDTLFHAVDPAYRCLLLTAAGTGLRWGELAGLRRDRLDLLRRRLTVDQTLNDVNGELSVGEPKTGASRRVVTLPAPVLAGLAEYLRGHTTELVFTSPDGQPLRRSDFYSRVWTSAVRAAELDPAPRFHDLRQTHVALLSIDA